MIILENSGKTIELKIDDKIGQTQDRRNYMVSVPVITCTSRTDTEKMQDYINTFVYNLSHELLGLAPKVTLREAKLAEMKEEPKVKEK